MRRLYATASGLTANRSPATRPASGPKARHPTTMVMTTPRVLKTAIAPEITAGSRLNATTGAMR